MSQKLKIGNMGVGQGEKRYDYLKVADRPLFSIDIPITIISGLQPGPTLCVMAGQHACEYAGIETCIRLSKNIEPEELSGTLLILPVINVPAFVTRTPYVNPIDGVNMADAWPGKLGIGGNTISYFMTYAIFNNVIRKSNYIVDLHGGDLVESMSDYGIYFNKTQIKEVDESNLALAKAFGIRNIVIFPPPEKASQVYGGGLLVRAAELGIPGILCEAGHEGKLEEEDVLVHYNGIHNVMKFLRMIEGEPVINAKPRIIRHIETVSSKTGGLFYSNYKVGSLVHKGVVLAEIRNIKGETVEKIFAPIDGKILYKVNSLPWDPSFGSYLFVIIGI